MNLLDLVMNASGGGAVNQLSRNFGLSEEQTMSAMASLVPALQQGLSRNTAQAGGLDGLIAALSSGGHQRSLEDTSILGSPENIADGNGILGHILGSKDVSRAVAAQASQQTGIGTEILKKMLPVIASLVMASLSKQAQSAPSLPNAPAEADSGLGGLGGFGFLTQMLDSNRDGSVIDDVFGMLGGLFKR